MFKKKDLKYPYTSRPHEHTHTHVHKTAPDHRLKTFVCIECSSLCECEWDRHMQRSHQISQLDQHTHKKQPTAFIYTEMGFKSVKQEEEEEKK